MYFPKGEAIGVEGKTKQYVMDTGQKNREQIKWDPTGLNPVRGSSRTGVVAALKLATPFNMIENAGVGFRNKPIQGHPLSPLGELSD
jgi:hypothetical protein